MNNMLHLNTASFRDPEASPEGPKTTEPLDPDIAKRNAELVERFGTLLFSASAQEILAWAHEHAPGPLAVTLSMENTVLAELAKRYLPGADFLFLDTSTTSRKRLRWPMRWSTATRSTAWCARKRS